MPSRTSRLRLIALSAACIAAALAASGVHASPAGLPSVADSVPLIPDSLRGRSGALRLALLLPSASSRDDSAARSLAPLAATWSLPDVTKGGLFHFVEMIPFAEKRDGRVGAYTVGRFPGERRNTSHPQWGVPAGFISVTPELLTLPVSVSFVLGDFVSLADQRNVWPRAVVLDLRLVDKLELILEALRDSGVVNPKLKVMSGFRTPSVTLRNARTAQAPDSRHQYGDAADVVVDANGDGRMDDLTKDRRVDINDARYLVRVIQAVEAAHPDLIGGIGVYPSRGLSGPFVHVDARGERARWGLQ